MKIMIMQFITIASGVSSFIERKMILLYYKSWVYNVGPLFVKFALSYRTVVCTVLSVCDVGVLWLNG